MKLLSFLSVCLMLFSCATFKPHIAFAKVRNSDPTFELKVVDQATLEVLFKAMEKAKEDGAEKINLRINSFGGEVVAGFNFAQSIENLGIPVICLVDSAAMSMGFYILQSCTERYMTKRSVLMVHEPSLNEVGGNYQHLEQAVEFLKKLSDAMAEHEASRLTIDVQQLKINILNKDWYMSWDEALEVRAIDGIVDAKDIPKPIVLPEPQRLFFLR